jgi:hypothetical protein
LSIDDLPVEEVDWMHRGEYIRTRSARKERGEFDVEPAWATEAATDPARVIAVDRSSVSGRTVRVIGWSAGADRLLTVLLLPKGDPMDGRWWGVNAWASNSRDQRTYPER